MVDRQNFNLVPENEEEFLVDFGEVINVGHTEKYSGGNGINISDENVISVDTDVVQEKLTAGENITIENNVISATDTTYTAGTGINITDNVISATGGGGTSDFNDLTNRPQYNGSAMTGSTNIPKVPTKTSDLTNDGADGTSTYVEADELSTVATTGNYNDLSNKPTIPTVLPADFFTANSTFTSTSSSSLSLTDTLNAKFEDVKLYGDTTQQTYTGKNLFNGVYEKGLINGTTGADMPNDDFIRSKDFIPVSENSVYTLSVENYTGNFFWYEYKSDYSYNLTNNKVNDTGVFNTNAGTAFVRFRLGNFTDMTAKTQVEAGSMATAYEPYVGGVPAPNPDYPQDIHVATGTQTVEVSGKNLFNIQPEVVASVSGMTNTFNTDGSMTTTGKPTTDYALMTNNLVLDDMLEDGETYVISQDEYVGNIYIQIQIVNKSTSVTTFLSATTEAKSFTVNKAINSYRIRVQTGTRTNWGDVVRTYKITYQLEKTSTATTVEPYQSQSYSVRLGSLELAKIGDYQDYIYKSGDDWYVHKDISKTIFDGSVDENWSTASSGTDNYMYNAHPISDAKTTDVLSIVCNYESPAAITTSNTFNGVTLLNYGGVVYVRIRSGAEMPIASWKAKLNTTNMVLYYLLATPTDTKITDTDLISDLNALATGNTYDGETNIIITATGTNLPALLKAVVYTKSLAGMSELLSDKQEN